MLSYTQLTSQITAGSVVSFTEYSLDRRERKHVTLSIDHALVHEVIPANIPIGRAALEEYYGDNLSDQDYLQLSCVNCVRYVLLVGVDELDKPEYKPIFFNQDYYELGLQTLEVINGGVEEPIYTQAIADNQFFRVPIILNGEEY